MELADIVAVNKADGDLQAAARRAAGDYRHALRMLPPSTEGWKTPVLTYSAREGTGLAELWGAVMEHRAVLESSGQLASRRAEQQRHWLSALLAETVLRRFRSRAGFAADLARAEAAVADGKMTVPQAVAQLVGE
jgi:LAO/AO transport system kinase